jgi:hypothetical protein
MRNAPAEGAMPGPFDPSRWRRLPERLPEPVAPLRTRGPAPPKVNQPPDRRLWDIMPSASLWEAVSLVLDIEPVTLSGRDTRTDRVGGEFDDCPDDFRTLLKIACHHVEDGLLLCADPAPNRPYSKVQFADFLPWAQAYWAQAYGRSVPAWLSENRGLSAPHERALEEADREVTRPEVATFESEPEGRQAQRKIETKNLHDTWHRIALLSGYTPNGHKRKRQQIADEVVKHPQAKHPSTGAVPSSDTVKRELNRNYKGWAEKSWANKSGKNFCP